MRGRSLRRCGGGACVPRLRAWLAATLVLLAFLSDGAASGNLTLDGPLVQGGVVLGRTDPGARVVLEGKEVRVAADGRFVIGFGRDAPARMRLEVGYGDGTGERRDLAIRRRAYPVERIDGLPPNLVTPPAAELERIQRENALIMERRERDTPVPFFASGFSWPVTGAVTGVYGSRRILNGEPRQPHYGVDIAAPDGTPVTAPADGIVALAHAGMYFTGKTLLLDHGHGLSSTLLHLSAIDVKEGERVARGQPVGRVGATGRVTGPHLDWRLNWFAVRLDPETAVPPLPGRAPGPGEGSKLGGASLP